MPCNILNSDYSNVLTIQIDLCFLQLLLSPLIRTQIEDINEQQLVDFNWHINPLTANVPII